jgi:hypothetical protein
MKRLYIKNAHILKKALMEINKLGTTRYRSLALPSVSRVSIRFEEIKLT